MDIDTCVFDMKQLFFNSLCLLGFDAQAMEASHKIPFNKNMFELPNKHGAEIVLHFLFQRLNATMCKEAFRDCWPILDKKREQSFRKNCYNWLSKISQEEPDSHLPRINASLFLSPGGDKFYQMLFHFSGYVLQKVVETELGSKLTDRLRYPTLNTDNLQIGDVVMKTLTCSSIRHRNNYFNAAQLKMKVNREWKETADDYVKHYRKLNKEIRELDFQYREEEQRSIEAALARGSPAKRRSGQSDKFDPEFDPRTIKRSQRIQQVREMWKQVEDYDRNKEAEVEVVESIVQKTINKYKLDAADINVKVPDMLLRECGDEIRRRNVDNTYQGGKLNLVSVLQLWSLCLHLYLEKINQVGLPKFGEEVKKLTAQAHLQQNYKKNSQTLRQQMSERVPLLKASIEKLTQKLDSTLFVDKSPESIRTTSVGLGLVGPSPKPSFSPDKGKTPTGGIGVPKLSNSAVDTPVAVNQISEKMKTSVRRQGPDSLFKSPQLKLDNKLQDVTSSIPRPRDSQPSSRKSSRPNSARSNASSRSSTKATPRSSKEKVVRHTASESRDDHSFTKVSSPRTMMERLNQGDHSIVSDIGKQDSGLHAFHPVAHLDRSNCSDRTLTSGGDVSIHSVRSVRSDFSNSVHDDTLTETKQNTSKVGRKTPTDYLVDEIMGEGEILSPFNSGMEAFQTRTEIRRTPELLEAMKHEGVTTEVPDQLLGVGTTPGIDDEQFVDIEGPEQLNVNPDGHQEESPLSRNTKNDKIESCDKDLFTDKSAIQTVSKEQYNEVNTEDLDRDIDTSDLNVLNASRQSARSENFDQDIVDNADLGQGVDSFTGRGREFGDVGGVGFVEGRTVNDDVVQDMIDEGIRQVTCDGLRGLDDNRDHLESDDDLQVEEIVGPDIEEVDNLSDISQRSTENPIVIDKSINMTPKLKSDRGQPILRSPESPVTLLEDETFPELENSPREPIVIDSSFQTPNRGGQSGSLSFTSDRWNMNNSATAVPRDALSMSLQTGLFGDKTPLSKDLLSRSLVTERSPLSDEIRKMFKKAVADTPPRGTASSDSPWRSSTLDSPSQSNKGGSRNIDLPQLPDLELIDSDYTDHRTDSDKQQSLFNNRQSNSILKQTDISWDNVENLDDIELPSFSESESVDIDKLLQKGENVLQLEQDDGLNLEPNDFDEFFADKTPELPKRKELLTRKYDTGGASNAVDEASFNERPKFPQIDEDPSPLICFTP